MNAVLQCFYYCPPLTDYFLNLKEYSINQLGLISKGYYKFIKGISSGNVKAAFSFKEAMIAADSSFIGSEGKDSKDVAILILSEIHEELKENDKSLLNANQKVNYQDEVSVFEEKINLDKMNGNNTIISKTFEYFLLCEQKCKKCCQNRKGFFNIEADNILIFEMEYVYKKISKKKYNKYYPIISIEDCLDYYTSNEVIDCIKCKNHSLELTKKFCKLPKIFVFVLSRGLNANFNCTINFSPEIDLRKYYSPVKELYREKSTEYNLICATFAYDWWKGTGHTVAFCKTYKSYGNNYQYYVFNDSSTRKTSIEEIRGKTPYLLFYERNK
jgi:hypothetical protein